MLRPSPSIPAVNFILSCTPSELFVKSSLLISFIVEHRECQADISFDWAPVRSSDKGAPMDPNHYGHFVSRIVFRHIDVYKQAILHTFENNYQNLITEKMPLSLIMIIVKICQIFPPSRVWVTIPSYGRGTLLKIWARDLIINVNNQTVYIFWDIL